MKTFPTLFKKTSTGADQSWTISVEGNVIVSRWGQVGGKIQESRDEIKEGKNLGKANATTAEAQAESEAQSLWTKKKRNGYNESLTAAQAGEVDASVVEGGYFPMLAKDYEDCADSVLFPLYVQPKMDGHRIPSVVDNNRIATMWTRKRKPVVELIHIISALNELRMTPGSNVDGEGYVHTMSDDLEKLTSMIRNGHPDVQYWIYDINLPGVPFKERTLRIKELIPENHPCLKIVPTFLVGSAVELRALVDTFIADGYEGGIARSPDGMYLSAPPPTRSNHLLKVKLFVDAEFKIVRVLEGRGKFKGAAKFVCVTDEGNEFEVVMNAPITKLQEYYRDADKYIGRLLTVKYTKFSKKKKVPKIARGLRFYDPL